MPRPIPREFEKRDALAVGTDGEVVLIPPSVREAADDLGPGYDGYPLRWMVVDSYGTAFQRGAAKKSIKEREREIPVLWQHDPYTPIGRHALMREDKDGLFVRAVISDTAAGRDAMTLLRDGVPLGLSFGFQTVKDRAATDDDDLDFSVAPEAVKRAPRDEIRVITEVAYWEDSPVTFAANPRARPGDVRSLADLPPETLSLLLDAIRGRSLPPEQRALVEQIVAAWGDGAEPPDGAPALTPAEARHEPPEPESAAAPTGPDIDAVALRALLARGRLALAGAYA